MTTVDWRYHRKNCTSCSKAAAFLDEREIRVKDQDDARSTPIDPADVLKLLAEVSTLYVTRGKKVYCFDFSQERPDDALLLSLLIGRSGNLRAPALRVGKTFIVGFDEQTYGRLLCQT